MVVFADELLRTDCKRGLLISLGTPQSGAIIEAQAQRAVNIRLLHPGEALQEAYRRRSYPSVQNDAITLRIGVDSEADAQATFAVSQRAVKTANQIFHSNPDLLAKVHRGETTLKGAYHQVKQRQDHQRITTTLPPTGTYQVLVIDPPWPYTNRDQDPSHRAKNPYVSLSLEEISKLSIPASPDSIVWLWTTNAFLPDAFGLLAAWGFEYKTMVTWAKNRFGLGDWLRGQTEHCLLGVRGTYRVTPGRSSTLLVANVRAHSEKPEEFYALVEKICPGNRLEMFARDRRDGWDGWGAGYETN